MGCAVISRVCRLVTAALASLWVLTAQAQAEFYDATLNRYFLSADPGEVAFIDGGGAGRSWVRTGYGFSMDSCSPTQALPCAQQVPVCRFYGAPPLGSGSHFFTADPGECDAVRRNPAWRFEGTPFKTVLPNPATGTCPNKLLPVYRSFNNAAKSTEVRHRWTASRAVQDRMLAMGWKDEGVVFCANFADQSPLRSFDLRVTPARILTSAECASRIDATHSCIGSNNLPAPRNGFNISTANRSSVFDNAGFAGDGIYSASDGHTIADIAADTFVTLTTPYPFPDFNNFNTYGIHVSTKSRGPANLSSVNPLYQFDLFAPADGEPDTRFIPFAGQYDTDVDVVISFWLRLKKLRVTPGSAAYGHTTIDARDRSTGLHLYFMVLAYGTVPTTDNVIRDGAAGNPIVVTAFRESPYGRNYAARVMDTPAPFDWPGIGAGGYYEFHVNTAEFRRVVESARTLEPRLSENLADYAFDDFQFNSEVAGDGEIGENFQRIRIELVETGARAD